MVTGCVCTVRTETCCCGVQAMQSLKHPWFADLDMNEMDELENPEVITDALASEALA